MQFVHVPPGKFMMGSLSKEEGRGEDEVPHEVTLSKAYWLGAHEITQSQYERIMGKNPSFFKPGQVKIQAKETSQHPVECVTWHETLAFCKKLGEVAEEKAQGRTYRLPTEAEWEFACRAGSATALHYGNSVNSYQANFNGLSPLGLGGAGPFHRRTERVGAYKANRFGLYDMHGNVMEWCADWYEADYYKTSPKEDPPGPKEGTTRVTRGGSWSNSCKACRSAVRTKLDPGESHYGLGFRVVMVREK